ncbi:hypothetical protein DFS34DRAFT_44377 [Phlyctochytrium arcticum]|nr:hypothetical protein DFS34DRAFT_44377 [Phlyctochytrium arcticum]
MTSHQQQPSQAAKSAPVSSVAGPGSSKIASSPPREVPIPSYRRVEVGFVENERQTRAEKDSTATGSPQDLRDLRDETIGQNVENKVPVPRPAVEPRVSEPPWKPRHTRGDNLEPTAWKGPTEEHSETKTRFTRAQQPSEQRLSKAHGLPVQTLGDPPAGTLEFASKRDRRDDDDVFQSGLENPHQSLTQIGTVTVAAHSEGVQPHHEHRVIESENANPYYLNDDRLGGERQTVTGDDKDLRSTLRREPFDATVALLDPYGFNPSQPRTGRVSAEQRVRAVRSQIISTSNTSLNIFADPHPVVEDDLFAGATETMIHRDLPAVATYGSTGRDSLTQPKASTAQHHDDAHGIAAMILDSSMTSVHSRDADYGTMVLREGVSSLVPQAREMESLNQASASLANHSVCDAAVLEMMQRQGMLASRKEQRGLDELEIRRVILLTVSQVWPLYSRTTSVW